jgi:hypothetical protein
MKAGMLASFIVSEIALMWPVPSATLLVVFAVEFVNAKPCPFDQFLLGVLHLSGVFGDHDNIGRGCVDAHRIGNDDLIHADSPLLAISLL